ncbi:hypothetical protein [Janibacter limosus]|uniref:hypothetical protein n=1 Tax=Janibacter limosus TaxID=53458 RepID=UPI000836D6B2|nr:hypothetical protein [Janibacter limosus]
MTGQQQPLHFEARSDLGEWAAMTGWMMRGIAVITLVFFVILGATGVIPFTLEDDWFMLLFAVLGFPAMWWLLPRSFRADAELKMRQPLLVIHATGFSYAGSRVPDAAVRAVIRADLNPIGEHSSYVKGDAFYVHVHRDRLGFTRKDSIIETRRGVVTIPTSDFAEPARAGLALIAHLEAAGLPFADGGSSHAEVIAIEKRLQVCS